MGEVKIVISLSIIKYYRKQFKYQINGNFVVWVFSFGGMLKIANICSYSERISFILTHYGPGLCIVYGYDVTYGHSWPDGLWWPQALLPQDNFLLLQLQVSQAKGVRTIATFSSIFGIHYLFEPLCRSAIYWFL